MRTDAIIRSTLSRRTLLGAAGLTGLSAALAACSSDEGGGGDNPAVGTVEWWHIQNLDPLLTLWEGRVGDFNGQSEGSVEATVLENQQFKDRLTTALQAGDVPDLFQSWGGGVMHQHNDAGLIQNLSDRIPGISDRIADYAKLPYQIDGQLYGIPWSMGMVGFWYNIPHFEAAGISEVPASWEGFLEAVDALKGAGTTPIALAGQDQWPAHFYWTYLAMRVGGIDVFTQARENRSVEADAFVEAGVLLQELTAMEPFQEGFQNAQFTEGGAASQAALMDSGTTAIELMGQWAPGAQRSAGGTDGLGDDLGFFAFPAVDGGAGALTEVLGGGDGFEVGRDAPDTVYEFLEFFYSEENYHEAATDPGILTVMPEADDTVDAHGLQVLEALNAATGFQLYLDQDWPPAVGLQVNASVAELINGDKDPEQILTEITEVWQREEA